MDSARLKLHWSVSAGQIEKGLGITPLQVVTGSTKLQWISAYLLGIVDPVAGEVEHDRRVGRAIEQRIADLMLTMAEVTERSGVSYKTLVRYIDGHRIERADKERQLALALNWTMDSLTRIRRGEEPIELTEDQVRAVRLEEQVADMRSDIKELKDLLLRLDGQGRS